MVGAVVKDMGGGSKYRGRSDSWECPQCLWVIQGHGAGSHIMVQPNQFSTSPLTFLLHVGKKDIP